MRKFGLLWLITFIVYLPAIKGGWVIDATGWLYNIRHQAFWDYINRSQTRIPSLYQFTQLTTYLLYRVVNANPVAWHTIMVTMHACNAWLLYTLCKRLFEDSGIKTPGNIALTGVILYTICPHITEVIVWEASFHFLQGFMLILVIMKLAQKYLHEQKPGYIIAALFLFICSAFALEVFYLTPWFVLSLGIYYRYALGYHPTALKKLALSFVLPQLVIFGIQIMLLRMTYGAHFAHIGESVVQPLDSYLSKPLKYVFHLLFFGRFFSHDIRTKAYTICESVAGMAIFYTVLAAMLTMAMLRLRKMDAKGKVSLLVFAWMAFSLVILLPLAFPDLLLVFYDRYTYMLNGFVFMFIALFVSRSDSTAVRYSIVCGYGLINLFFAVKLNLLWKHSAYIDNRLLQELPPPGDKTVILLNIPENMQGIPMIGAQPDDQYTAMRNLLVDSSIKNKIWDGASYNMNTLEDGAHVVVKSDSTVQVVLNQWGTWWWYEGHGGRNYETTDYKLEMEPTGNSYLLTLKRPPGNFMLLYSVGPLWKKVDIDKKGVEQW